MNLFLPKFCFRDRNPGFQAHSDHLAAGQLPHVGSTVVSSAAGHGLTSQVNFALAKLEGHDRVVAFLDDHPIDQDFDGRQALCAFRFLVCFVCRQ